MAVIVAVPADTAVTRPVVETVATESELDVQLTFLFVAFDGLTVAVSCPVSPSVNDISDVFNETPVTEITFFFTVTLQVAVLLPSSVVTVIVAVPSETAVTKPLEETVATEGELVVQLTLLFVASDGRTVAVSWLDSPSVNVKVDLSSQTPVTEITFLFTVTLQVAVQLPSSVVTVIVAVPSDIAVTSPDEETEAMTDEVDFHLTLLIDALDGKIVAVSCFVSPSVISNVSWDRDTDSTGI